MKKIYVAAITAATLTLSACGGSETDVAAETTTTEAAAGPIKVAGGEAEVLSLADMARDFCHEETTYAGIPIADSKYIFDEFQGAYVEEDGRYIRHVIAGAVDVEAGDGVDEVAYLCSYLQRQTQTDPAVNDNLGILTEDYAVSTSTNGGEIILSLRDHLRGYHNASRGDVRVYDLPYAEADSGWENPHPSAPTDVAESTDVASSTFGDGTHMVGTDIRPGTYRTDGGEGCYWERLSGLSGTDADRITNDFSMQQKQTYVTIEATDAAFESKRCGTWKPVG